MNEVEQFRFDEKTHSYFLGEKRLTGVTSIIGVLAKPALIGWSARVAVEYIENFFAEGVLKAKDITVEALLENDTWKRVCADARTAHTKKKEAAGTHGTDSHILVEEYVKVCLERNSGKPGLYVEMVKFAGPKSWGPMMPFIDWSRENVDHFLFSERRMFNKEHWIAGTCDFAYVDKQGRRVVSDFKTSGSGIYYEMWIQTAAYQLLGEGMGDEKYDYRTIVRLDKKGEFEVQERHDYETDKDAFLCALKLYRAMGTYTKH